MGKAQEGDLPVSERNTINCAVDFYRCADCRTEMPTLFMLKDSWWDQIARPDEILCFACTEMRLFALYKGSRPITFNDLKEDHRLTREMLLGLAVYLQSPEDQRREMVRRIPSVKGEGAGK